MSDRERESSSLLPIVLAGILIVVLVSAVVVCGGFFFMRIWVIQATKAPPPATAPAKLPPTMKAP